MLSRRSKERFSTFSVSYFTNFSTLVFWVFLFCFSFVFEKLVVSLYFYWVPELKTKLGACFSLRLILMLLNFLRVRIKENGIYHIKKREEGSKNVLTENYVRRWKFQKSSSKRKIPLYKLQEKELLSEIKLGRYQTFYGKERQMCFWNRENIG